MMLYVLAVGFLFASTEPSLYPAYQCEFGTKGGLKTVQKVQFSLLEIQSLNRELKKLSKESCEICTAGKPIVLAANGAQGEQVKFEREYLYDKPHRLLVTLMNKKGQPTSTYATDISAESFKMSAGVEIECKRLSGL